VDSVGGSMIGYVNLSSARRFKEDIQPMDNASEALFSLKPVKFHYKPQFDSSKAQRFGLIAEEVEKVNANLVARNERGELTTVRYEAVNAMLLNEFLKEHGKVEQQSRIIQQQEVTINQLKSTVTQQEEQMKHFAARFEEQDVRIQRVTDQLRRPKAPSLVLNEQ